jgi:hypothetical protein
VKKLNSSKNVPQQHTQYVLTINQITNASQIPIALVVKIAVRLMDFGAEQSANKQMMTINIERKCCREARSSR